MFMLCVCPFYCIWERCLSLSIVGVLSFLFSRAGKERMGKFEKAIYNFIFFMIYLLALWESFRSVLSTITLHYYLSDNLTLSVLSSQEGVWYRHVLLEPVSFLLFCPLFFGLSVAVDANGATALTAATCIAPPL